MKKSHFLILVLLIGCAAVSAWQTALSTLGFNPEELQPLLLEQMDGPDSPVYLPRLSTPAKAAAMAMTEQQRAATVREIGGFIKTLVMSTAFQEAHAAQIKKSHYAVNHGFKEPVVTDPMAAGMQAMAAQMAMMFRTFPIEALKEAFAQDQETWNENAKSDDPEERAQAQKMLARGKQIAPLLQSNAEQFKQAYSLLKSEEMKGPATEAELQAATSQSENTQKMRTEQAAWDQYNLKVVLKKKLTALAAEASSVDFTAQLKDEAGRKVFVNPAHERRSYMWKAMYRAGKAPTAAVLEITNAWLKEL